MNCAEVKIRLDEAANSAHADRVVADSGLRSHLDVCPSCRTQFVAAHRLLDFVNRQKTTAAAVPAEEVQATRTAILRAVAERQRRAPRAFLPVWLTDPLLASAPALAAFAVIVFGIVELRRGTSDAANRVPVGTVSPAATPPHTASAVGLATEPVAPPPAASKGKSPADSTPQFVTIAAFQAEFDRLKASQTGVTQGFLLELLAWTDRGIESSGDRIAAHQLLVDTYEQLGQSDQALTAFGEYLDLVESRAGRERAVAAAEAKANALFDKQRDYLRAMAYYDLVSTRYPGTPEAHHARFMGGRYFQRQEMWAEAAKEYRRITDELPAESCWRKRATMELPLVLANAGRPEEGIAIMARFAEDAHDPRDVAYAHFEIGCLNYHMGLAYYPNAIKHFRVILDKYAGHGYDRDTLRMLARMEQKVTAELSIGTLN